MPSTAPISHRIRQLGLTEREADVLRLVADGMTNTEIGEELHMSRRTVQRHLAAVYDKLGVRTRAGAVYIVFAGTNGVPATELR